MADNIKIDFKEMGCDGMNWIQLTQDRVQCRALLNTKMKNSGAITGREFLDQLSGYQPLKEAFLR
jgi:hypothetical protein